MTVTSMKTKNEPALQAYIANYFQTYLVSERGVSDHTLRAYAYTIKTFADYLYRVKHISLDRMNLTDFNYKKIRHRSAPGPEAREGV